MKYLGLFLLILGIYPHSAVAQHRRGGLSGSGGGSGVICFPTLTLAEQADTYLKQNKILPETLLNQGTLQILEAWEMAQTDQEIQPLQDQQTWQQYLNAVKSNVRYRFPIFMHRLELATELLDLNHWQDIEKAQGQSLSLLEDANPIVKLPDPCRRVQIVIRDSRGDNAKGSGPTVHKPEIKIKYIKRYFDHLPATDQAILFFHEQLYVLGKAIGHENSDHIRGFVRIFFSTAFNQPHNDRLDLYREQWDARIKYDLVIYFGDYLKWFNEDNPVADAERFSAQHHFYVYLEFMKKRHQEMRQCLELKYSSRHCMFKVMDPVWNMAELTEEEAFMFIAAHPIELMLKYNTDRIMDPHADNAKLFVKTMNHYCTDVPRELSIKVPQMTNTIAYGKFLSYCKTWQSARDPGK